MIRLVHPAPPPQPPPPPRRRAALVRLTEEEHRHARTVLRNVRPMFGSWAALAKILGVRPQTLSHALEPGRGAPMLFFRVAQAAGISFEEMLSGRLTVAGRCNHCGATVRSAPERRDEECPYP